MRRWRHPNTKAIHEARIVALAAAFALGLTHGAASAAEPSAATLQQRMTQTIYPEKGVPLGYGTPLATQPAGENPRVFLLTFTRTADQVVSRVRYDLYDDAASLAKHYPYDGLKRFGAHYASNEVIYRFGSYRGTCAAYYVPAKTQVTDACGMVIGATLIEVITTYAVPAGVSIDEKTQSNGFLDSIRTNSTALLTDGATFYIDVSGAPQ